MSLRFDGRRTISGISVELYKSTGDDRLWREMYPTENLDPEQEVIVGSGNPTLAREYAALRLPGGTPFLPAIAALMPVYILAEKEAVPIPQD